MKKKLSISILILIVSIICCGCAVNTIEKTCSYTPSHSYQHEDDITYKKDANDHSPVVYITRTGARYHRFGCTHAKNLYVKLTVRQATGKGYTACYYCCY